MNDDSSTIGVDVSPLRVFAVQSHELFTELKNAGFDENQAISILVGLMTKE